MKKIAGMMIAAVAMSGLAGCAAETGDAGVAEEGQTACSNPEGTNAMIAALASAMGTELGRWELLTDFYEYRGFNNQMMLGLSSAGLSQCSARGNACNNIKNLLAFQDSRKDGQIVFGTNKLSSWSFASRLTTGWENMRTYKQNNMYKYDAHLLSLTGSAPGGCDTLYSYNVTTPGGVAFTSTQMTNLANALKWTEANGANPYIAYQVTASTCTVDPTGNVTEGDTSSQGTVWGCQKYNPGSDINGQSCYCPTKITNNGGYGKIFNDASAPLMFICKQQ